MTLLTTEIHNHNDKDRALIIYAADRRLSHADGRPGEDRVKTLRLVGLNGGIGYFGLAQVGSRFMDEWLAEFMRSRPVWASLQEFSAALAEALNAAHVVAWSAIDESFGRLLGMQHIRTLTTPAEYVEWVRFKMETIARFYESFATRSIIGRPIAAFVITRS